MGAGYHSIHHTSYKHNYGHYTIFMDQLFGTMLTPEDEEEEKQAKMQKAQQKASPASSVSDPLENELNNLAGKEALKAAS